MSYGPGLAFGCGSRRTLARLELLGSQEAKVLIEQWRREFRPHSSLGYRPPAPEAIQPDPAFLKLPTAALSPGRS